MKQIMNSLLNFSDQYCNFKNFSLFHKNFYCKDIHKLILLTFAKCSAFFLVNEQLFVNRPAN